MVITKSISRIFSVLFIAVFLLMGVLPVQAEAPVNPLSASGDFLWAKSMGGTGYDDGLGIAVDSSNNVYTTGYFEGTVDFDPGAGVSNLTSAGGIDIFVSKSDSSGNFVWAKNMGGSGDDFSWSISIDANDKIYTTGGFADTADFDPGVGISNLIGIGFNDIFVSKLDNNGNFLWAKSIGGTSNEFGIDIKVDSGGNVYTTGFFESTVDFDPGAGTFNLVSAGWEDTFVSKLDNNGNFVWAKSMGGTDPDLGYGIAIDSIGNVYTTGTFFGVADFDSGPSIFNIISAGSEDIFITKLDSNGNFLWAKSMGGTEGFDEGRSITVDSSGNIYSTGQYHGTADFDPGAGAYNLISAGFSDIFVTKLDSNGNFVWAKSMGGIEYDHSYSIAVDSSGNVYTTGYFENTADFDPGAGTSNVTSAGIWDIFISKLDSSGNFVWAKSMGGIDYDTAYDIALDSSGSVYTTGYYQGSVDFDPGAGTVNLTSVGLEDIFISKLQNSAIFVKWDASGANNGTSWADAYTDLQSALLAASSGDEVWVAAGTYKPTTGTNRTATFQLKNGVAVYGGFAGIETLRSDRDPAVNVTILSGDIDNNDSQTPIITSLKTVTGNNTNSYHVLTGATGSTLDGFIITAGSANKSDSAPFPYNCGGGMYNNAANPTLSNIIFKGNLATNSGGGLRNDSSNPILTDIVFSDNSAGSGGGMVNISSSPTLTNVSFNDNWTPSDGDGGGMSNNSTSSPALTNVIFNGNSADYGGGMFNKSGSNPILTDVIFSGNSAGLQGGGMENTFNSDPTLINVTFSNNLSISGGGMRNFYNSNPLLVNVTFSGNSATYGGGMENNSTSSPILKNVTFSNNSASLQGGGIYNLSSNPTIYNTIFWRNTAIIVGAQIYNNSSFPNVNDSIVQDGCPTGSVCTNIIIADPVLRALGNYGGFTQTMALGAGSPAIDAGDNTNCPVADQRGVARPQGSRCDIGAYEYVNDVPTFSWNTFQGGSNSDRAVDMVMDSAGNVYLVGNSDSPIWEKSPINPLTSGSDAFVAKFNQNGTLLWYTFMGSGLTDFNFDNGTGIALDPNGDIYVLGTSSSTWGNNPLRAFSGSDDVFVAKLNANGQMQWHTFLGGSEADYSPGIDSDQTGNIYITGSSASDWGNTAPTPLNPFVGVPHNDLNPFVARLSSDGQIQWYTFLAADTQGMDIAVNTSGIYAMGYSFSPWGSPIRAYTGSADIYVAKLGSNGVVQWNTFLGGAGIDDSTGNDIGVRIKLNSLGDIFITGESGMPWGNAPVESGGGGLDGFVAKLNSNGALQWTSFVGGAGADRVSGIAIDESDGSLLIAGESEKGWGRALLTPYNQNGNTFLAKLDSTGALHWNALFGTIPWYSMGSSHSVALWHNNVFVSGNTYNTWGTPIHTYSALSDTYLLRAQLPAAPEAALITRTNPNPTSASNVDFTVTFTENVTGVDISDFTLTMTGGVSGATVGGVSGTGSTYTVTVNTGIGSGTLRLDVTDNNSIVDVALNPLGGAAVGDGNFTTGEVYTVIHNINFTDQLFHTSNPPTTVTIPNTHGIDIHIGTLLGSGSVGTTWNTAQDFFIEEDTCSGVTVIPAGSCTFKVRFLPWSLGAKTGTITVPSDAPDQPYIVALSGNSIAGTQLLSNRSFDTYSAVTNLPDLWTVSPGIKAGIDMVDSSWSFNGPLSFKFVGDGSLKILSQTINKAGVAGDDFSFNVMTKGVGIPVNAQRWILQVMFLNNGVTVENRNIPLTTGTFSNVRLTRMYTAASNYNQILFRVHYGKSSGTAWIDLANLQWAP